MDTYTLRISSAGMEIIRITRTAEIVHTTPHHTTQSYTYRQLLDLLRQIGYSSDGPLQVVEDGKATMRLTKLPTPPQPTPTPADGDLISVPELAQIAGVSTDTVYKWLRKGIICASTHTGKKMFAAEGSAVAYARAYHRAYRA